MCWTCITNNFIYSLLSASSKRVFVQSTITIDNSVCYTNEDAHNNTFEALTMP